MATEILRKYENKPLAEYRSKVRSTKWWLKRFYTPVGLQRPPKNSLIVSLIFWAIGISIVLFYRIEYHKDERADFLIALMAVTTILTIIGMCYSYIKGIKKGKDAKATNM